MGRYKYEIHLTKVKLIIFIKATENQDKSKHDNLTIHTSTPASSKSTHKQIYFSLDNSKIDKDLFRTLTNTLVSDASRDIIIQSSKEIEYTPKSKEDNSGESESIHYINAVEAILFFDDKILTYFIEEANSMLPVEAEFQFTKIIRMRIIGEARCTVQDQNLTVYLN